MTRALLVAGESVRKYHRQASIEATNRFLSAHDLPGRLRLTDHYPYRVASARLDGVDARARLKLAVDGLLFAGEPNLLRRVRDALRTARDLPRFGRDVGLSEAAK